MSSEAESSEQPGKPTPKQSKVAGIGCLLILALFIWFVWAAIINPSKPAFTQFSAEYDAEHWLKTQYLRDPDSYQKIKSEIQGDVKSGYTLDLTFRAKNAFGGYTDGEAVFTFDGEGNLKSAVPSQ